MVIINLMPTFMKYYWKNYISSYGNKKILCKKNNCTIYYIKYTHKLCNVLNLCFQIGLY